MAKSNAVLSQPLLWNGVRKITWSLFMGFFVCLAVGQQHYNKWIILNWASPESAGSLRGSDGRCQEIDAVKANGDVIPGTWLICGRYFAFRDWKNYWR